MAGVIKVVVGLTHRSGLPEDRVFNTLFFRHEAAERPAIAFLANDIDEFYNNSDTGDGPADVISGVISRDTNVHTMDFYDVPETAAPIGSPFATLNWTLEAAPASTPLPSELAVVMSFHGDVTVVPEETGTTRPRARRRGRLFIGPLNDRASTAVSGSTAIPRVASAIRTGLAQNAESFLLTGEHDAEWTWGVFSHTSWIEGAVATTAIHDVTGGFVDDAFDVQRRRGEAALARTSWSA